MREYIHIIKTGATLIGFSAVLYFINYLLFGDAHHLLVVIAEELAFMPIYVFITAVIAERLLTKKEKLEMSRKMNALVGTFFTEMGYEMIKVITNFDGNYYKIKNELIDVEHWNEAKAKHIRTIANSHRYLGPEDNEDIYVIKKLMLDKRQFMLDLMSNSSLIEKDEFSELLLSVNHILEEFRTRGEISDFTEEDLEHLEFDIKRAYSHLINGWVNYMLHLQKEYPYLYVLGLRLNPFNR